MLSSASKHAILILQYLSRLEENVFCPVSDIAEAAKAPAPYLSKLVKELVWLGLIESKRGVGGGVRLAATSRNLSLFQVCNAMKDPLVKSECVLRNKPCDPKNPCAFHHNYKETRENLFTFLNNATIGDKESQLKKKGSLSITS